MLFCPSSYPFTFSNQCTWQHSRSINWSTTIYSDTLFSWHWRSNKHIWQFRKTSSHSFRDTDDPTNIYGNSGKLRQILSATLTIQQTYMVDLGYYRELSCYARTCKVCFRFLSHILVKWRSNETIASVGLAQARPNYQLCLGCGFAGM